MDGCSGSGQYKTRWKPLFRIDTQPESKWWQADIVLMKYLFFLFYSKISFVVISQRLLQRLNILQLVADLVVCVSLVGVGPISAWLCRTALTIRLINHVLILFWFCCVCISERHCSTDGSRWNNASLKLVFTQYYTTFTRILAFCSDLTSCNPLQT